MNTYHQVRQFTYTSKSDNPKENTMYANHMLVASQMADRLREAENARLGKLASHQRPARTPRSIAHRLMATSQTLRAPADDCLGAKVAERPA